MVVARGEGPICSCRRVGEHLRDKGHGGLGDTVLGWLRLLLVLVLVLVLGGGRGGGGARAGCRVGVRVLGDAEIEGWRERGKEGADNSCIHTTRETKCRANNTYNEGTYMYLQYGILYTSPQAVYCSGEGCAEIGASQLRVSTGVVPRHALT